MKEINCASIIIEERRKRGITQEELAAHLGVVKATVSKWETGISYPDISLLPLMATFFDISIDQLMGYTPQMPDEKIKELYNQLALDFTQKPFEEVITKCEGIIKKYYSCYLLLSRMVILYLNHAPLSENEERTEQILRNAIQLCERIISNCKDRDLIFGALNLQATCHLALNDGAAVLDLLGESLVSPYLETSLIAQAYQLLGNEEKAQEALQVDLYSKLMEIFDSMMIALQNNLGNLAKAEPIYTRAEVILNTFNMKYLNANNAAILYLFGAQMYQLGDMSEKSIEALSKYADVCINGFFPLSLKADNFFDKLDNFISKNAAPTPRSEATIKKDMVQHLNTPIFDSLRENADFKRIARRMSDFTEICCTTGGQNGKQK